MRRLKIYRYAVMSVMAGVLVLEVPAEALGGTWQEEGDGWYYLDQGERLRDTWVRGQKGALYYLDGQGRMAADTMVQGTDGRLYYVDSTGARVKNGWRQADGGSDDRAYEEYWYYFNGNGEAVKGKRVIGGKKYFFDEDGRMLTGWIKFSDGEAEPFTGNLEDKDGDVFYCLESGENASGWMNLYSPDEEDSENGELGWYNFDGGKVRTNAKEGLDGRDYIFTKAGVMVTGWVYDDDGTWQAVDWDTPKEQIQGYQEDVTKFYYAREDGSLAKDCWLEVECYDGLTGAGDEDKAWYYFDRKGRLTGRKATASPSEAMKVADTKAGAVCLRVHKGNKGKYEVKTGDGVLNEDAPTVMIQKVDGKYYMFNARGKLTDGLVYLPKTVGRFRRGYYNFDDDKALKMGEMILEDGGTDFHYYFAREKDKGYTPGQGVTGIFNGRLYYEGLAVTAEEGSGWQTAYIEGRKGHEIQGLFLVDEKGKVKSSGTVESEEGIQYRVSRISGQDPKKKGYAISFRNSGERYKGQEGYEPLETEDEAMIFLRPDQAFLYEEESDLYYPEGASAE